jgi:hypothetical protein
MTIRSTDSTREARKGRIETADEDQRSRKKSPVPDKVAIVETPATEEGSGPAKAFAPLHK